MRICNAKIVDPVTKLKGLYDIEIDKGVIMGVTPATGEISDGAIDATGLCASPGFCDVHVHFRDPGLTHKEDIYTGAKAAARGGYTDVIMMANTKPAIDNVETLRYVLDKGAETKINVRSCGSVTMGLAGNTLTDMELLKENGAIGFTDDGIPIMNEELLTEAFKKAAELKVPVSLHEEDKGLIKQNGINHGAASDYFGIYGSPREAETKLIGRDLKIALETGVTLNIQHISSKEGVELVRKAKKQSERIYAEVTPHHLYLTEDAIISDGANAKMNPPLRTKRDRAALIEGVKDKTISIIATDHAPHSFEEKNVDIEKAPSGIIGLETAFSISYMALVKSGAISLERLVEMLTVNPRKLYGMPNYGISKGAPADLVLFDEKEQWTFKESLSKSSNTPFMGMKLTGKIKYTICRGEIAYEDI